MELNKDYRFRDDLADSSSAVPIELLIPPYAGVVYKYGEVVLSEQAQGEELKLSYEYNIIEQPDGTGNLKEDKEFQKFIGLILNSFILEIADDARDPIRENDTQESNTE